VACCQTDTRQQRQRGVGVSCFRPGVFHPIIIITVAGWSQCWETRIDRCAAPVQVLCAASSSMGAIGD
jgi:hypothetical protein